ncbi:hypothetical protein WJX64_01675 [Leifsonia sp. YIM 134122]|uniref:Uncharacterized protein n=1 Tax=Leifsonia stereocauli TaxID=3134136 RepID=A0ABU9W0Q1_9MICO
MDRNLSWVLAAAGAVIVHFIASVMILFVLADAAYDFADSIPGGGEVSSADQLYKLGPSPTVGAYALAGVGILSAICTLIAAISWRTRRWAWLVPVVGILLSALAVVISISAFVPPPPDLGG